MTIAVLCSGQGPQHRGMFALTAGAPEAASLFAHAATLLGGTDPRDLVHVANDNALHENRLGQILCTLQALAAASVLRAELAGPRIIAGYSVGEVAAWGVAGMLDPTATLDAAARRAEAMDAASAPGDGMLFVRGLSRAAIDGLCQRHGVAVSIVNPGGAYVLGGAGRALDAVADEALHAGATRAVRVAVKIASHTSRLATAVGVFRQVLSQTPTKPALNAGVRLISGIDGAPVVKIAVGLDKLAEQVAQTVLWSDCLEGCIEAGASAFLELGPGHALSDMAATAYPGTPARSLDDFNTLHGAREWLRARSWKQESTSF
jgi:[acyl-carrier-protein] S-malonyltransferase